MERGGGQDPALPARVAPVEEVGKHRTHPGAGVRHRGAHGQTVPRKVPTETRRWHNHLNPAINHEAWSKQDDEILFDAHRRLGSKWKEISKLFTGRYFPPHSEPTTPSKTTSTQQCDAAYAASASWQAAIRPPSL